MITGHFVVTSQAAQTVWQSNEPNGIPATIALVMDAGSGPVHVALSARAGGNFSFDLSIGSMWSATSRSFYLLQVASTPPSPASGTYIIEGLPGL